MTTSVATICHQRHYYSTIDHIPYAVPFIPMPFSSQNWKLVSPTSPHNFLPGPPPLPSENDPFILHNYMSHFAFFFLVVYSFVFAFQSPDRSEIL